MNNQDLSAEFMINEFNAMKDLRELVINQVNNRVNVYLKIVLAAVTAIPTFSFIIVKSNSDINYFFFAIICLIVSILTLYWGVLSVLRVIEGHISAIGYTRAMNRVRRFFYDKDEIIGKYLFMPISDDIPTFGSYGFFSAKEISISSIALVMSINLINLLMIEFIVVWILNIKIGLSKPLIATLFVVGVIIAMIWYRTLKKIYKDKIEKAENHFRPLFPKD